MLARNRLEEVIANWEKDHLVAFKPTVELYKSLGISGIRFNRLRANEVALTLDEIVVLSDYFGCEPDQLVEYYETTIPDEMEGEYSLEEGGSHG